MKTNILALLGIGTMILLSLSCKKDDRGSGTKAVFSYIADGYLVNFTDFSQNAVEYSWDFGDQSESSTKANPVHVYKSKGEFLVSLTVKNGEQTSTFTDTVLIIGPNIKIDGDFTDWEYVEYSHTNPENEGGTLLAIKTFASAGYLNFYLEGTSNFNLEVIDLYLDADNNPAVGFNTWMYPAGSGADFLLEGNLNSASPAESTGSVFQHAGAPADWAWNEIASFTEAVKFSKMSTIEGKKAIEFSIKRDVLGTMKNQVNFAILEMNSGWTEVGRLPISQKPESKFLPFKL